MTCLFGIIMSSILFFADIIKKMKEEDKKLIDFKDDSEPNFWMNTF